MQRQHPEAYAAEAALAQAAAGSQAQGQAESPSPTQSRAPIQASAPRRMPLWVWLLFGSVVLLALLLLVR